jgi:hypothetical protein
MRVKRIVSSKTPVAQEGDDALGREKLKKTAEPPVAVVL